MKEIFDEEFLKDLERLKLAVKGRLSDSISGEHNSKAKSSGLEFTDLRNYSPGDDFRCINWKIFARTESLWTQEFEKKIALTVNLIIDASPSMGFGSPQKITFGKKIAAALAYISLVYMNKTRVFDTSRIPPPYYEAMSVNSASHLFEVISQINEGKTIAFSEVLEKLEKPRGKNLFIIISDLWDCDKLKINLKNLAARGNLLTLINILSPQEILPPFVDKVQLQDSENGRRLNRFVGEKEIEKYKTLLKEYQEDWRQFCFDTGINYVFVSTNFSFYKVVLILFRNARILE